jgi:diguanylate cyclase (GGDEF)-like protein
MTEDIKARFQKLGNLPTPPAVARDILNLARDPDTNVPAVAAAIGRDPALAAKVLRMANSSLYATRRQTQNLRQALTVLGIDATLTVCLGFSITGSLRASRGASFSYPDYWRRCLLAAVAGRCIADAAGLGQAEDVFLAALLQDLGMIAIDRSHPGFYAELAPEASHEARCAYEVERLGADHAVLGAFLLETWLLPEDLVRVVAASHSPTDLDAGAKAGGMVRCVAAGNALAAALMGADRRPALAAACTVGESLLGLDAAQMAGVIERIGLLTHDVGTMFETALLSAEEALALSEDAAEILANRNVEAMQEITTLKASTSSLEARAAELDDASRRDALTGVFNRRCFDERIAAEFAAAAARDLALLFLDLDHFKKVNDTYGHLAGDAVLKGSAQLIQSVLRAEDHLARFGGEEFVVLLPGASGRVAAGLGQRLLMALRTARHTVEGTSITVTASIGMAVHGPATPFPDLGAFIRAADEAAYTAKRAGRNRLVAHGMPPAAALAFSA